MENNEELDLEILDKELKPFVYKWTKGENDGTVCEYDSVFKDAASGIIWVNFRGGTRINHSLLNEYMMQLDAAAFKNNPAGPLSNIKEAVTIPNQLPGKNVMLADNTPQKIIDENPIVTLLQKQKPNWVNVGINLKLNLPTKSLYNVLTASFEDAEEKIIEFVVNDLDIEIIRDSLRINIKDIYKNGNPGKSRNNNNQKDEEQGDH